MVICLAVGSESSVRLGCGLVFIHCVTTTAEFYLVESLYRRFGTRSISALRGLAYSAPTLCSITWIIALVAIGLPGTSIFAAKVIFFISIAQAHIVLLVIMSALFFVVLPIALIRVFSTITGGLQRRQPGLPQDVSRFELMLFACCAATSVLIGLCPFVLI